MVEVKLMLPVSEASKTLPPAVEPGVPTLPLTVRPSRAITVNVSAELVLTVVPKLNVAVDLERIGTIKYGLLPVFICSEPKVQHDVVQAIVLNPCGL